MCVYIYVYMYIYKCSTLSFPRRASDDATWFRFEGSGLRV